LHDENTKLPALIKAALAHVQFETLHPFLDGNGRLGRLLITFILCVEGALTKPLLYLSLYLKANRQAYYDYLQSVRETGDWEAWIKFFLQGVVETSNQATETAISILDLFKKDRSLIEESGRGTALMIVYNHFQHYPLSNTTRLRAETKKPLPTILRSLASLEQLGIIKEISGKERHKVFVYREYLDILGRDTEPLISDIN
jgi:Fic family protein